MSKKDTCNQVLMIMSIPFIKKRDLKGLLTEPTEDSFVQFFRYIFVGGASFITDYLLFHLITEAGIYYLVSGVISFVAGLCVNYGLSKLLVFSKKTLLLVVGSLYLLGGSHF